MTFIPLVSLLAITITTYFGKCDKTAEINLITDYVRNDPSKLIVNAFLCWTKVEKYALFQKMSQNNNFLVMMNEIHLEDKSENILFITDLDCNCSKNILFASNKKGLFAAPFKWLFLTKNLEFVSNTNKYLLKYNFLVDNQIILAYKSNKNHYDLYELYKYTNTSKNVEKKYFTRWIFGKSFQNPKPIISSLSRRNLNGVLVRISCVLVHDDTLNHLTDYRFKHVDTITKVNYIFMNHLMDFVNATGKFSFEKTWGYLNKSTNMYSGMIGALQQNKAEVAGTALFITSDRVDIIEYVSLPTPTIISFIFRQPPLSYVTNIFTLPFTRGVWLCSILLCFIFSFLLYIAVSVEWKQSDEDSSASSAMSPSFADSILLMIGAVAQQGAVQEPRQAAGRIVMLCTFTALMFLYVSYSANIVALLQSSATTIRTLEDLLNSRLKTGVENIVYSHYYFETATEPIRKAIYEKKVAPKGQKANWVTLDVGVARMREGFYAFHGELGVIYKVIAETFFESEKCGLQEIKYIDVVEPYLAIKKNYTYKEIFKIGLFLIRETGLQSRELQKLYTKKPDCHTSGANFVSVGLIDVYPVLLVLTTGIGLSLLLFFFEIIVNKKQQQKNNNL